MSSRPAGRADEAWGQPRERIGGHVEIAVDCLWGAAVHRGSKFSGPEALSAKSS